MNNKTKKYIVIALIIIAFVIIAIISFFCPKANLTEKPELIKNMDNTEKIVFAVHPYESPVEIARNFTPIIEYLSDKLGKQFVLSVSKNYNSHIERVGNNQVDIAFMGPASYVAMTSHYGEKTLLGTFTNNEFNNFQGLIITRKDNPANSLKDLEGKSFGCSSRQSTMGYLTPRYLFIEAGLRFPEEQLRIVKSHNNVVLNVLSGDLNSGGVREQTYAKYKDRDLKIIASTPVLIDHPFLATHRLDEETITKIKEILYNIQKEDEVKRLLKPIKISATAIKEVKDSDYDELRAIIKAVHEDESQNTQIPEKQK